MRDSQYEYRTCSVAAGLKAPARGVPADVMIVRTRPSVHGNRVPEAFPNSKQGTKGRYELSSVRSSSTYP